MWIKMDLALNNLQWLICRKTKPNDSLLVAFFPISLILLAYQLLYPSWAVVLTFSFWLLIALLYLCYFLASRFALVNIKKFQAPIKYSLLSLSRFSIPSNDDRSQSLTFKESPFLITHGWLWRTDVKWVRLVCRNPERRHLWSCDGDIGMRTNVRVSSGGKMKKKSEKEVVAGEDV